MTERLFGGRVIRVPPASTVPIAGGAAARPDPATRAEMRRLVRRAEAAYDTDARVALTRRLEGNAAAWAVAFRIAQVNS